MTSVKLSNIKLITRNEQRNYEEVFCNVDYITSDLQLHSNSANANTKEISNYNITVIHCLKLKIQVQLM